nr:hypothetical protein [uncultured Fluviicola sp.]
MSKVDNLFNTAVNLADLISEQTEEKTPGVLGLDQPALLESDFSPRREPAPAAPEPEEPYDAEQEAKNLVHMLKAGEGLLLPPIAAVTLKKKRGGKKAIERMSKAHDKLNKGGELSELESKAAADFESYQDDIKKMMRLFYPDSDEAKKQMDLETKRLIEAAIPYCAATKFHINAGFAFWTMYTGSLGGKIIQIIGA